MIQHALYPVHPLPATDADLRNLDQPTPAQLSAKLDETMRKLGGFRSADVLDRVAYYSPIPAKDRKEHKIRVEPSQKGVRLLTREGYFGDAPEPGVLDVEQATFSAERRSPFDATDVGLRVALSAAPSGKAHLAIHADPADVLLEQRDRNHTGELSMMVALHSQSFLKEAAAPIPINVDLTPEQFAKAQKGGLDLSRDLARNPDIDKIRVTFFDRRLFGLGSVTVAALK